MELTSFIAGFLSAALTYALFTSKKELEPLEVIEDHIEYDDTTGRRVVMMCTSCRKQKPHVEIEHDLYQCTRCKRQVDLRR